MNEYFQTGSVPAPNSPGSSATIRAEFSSIAAAFDKLPVMAGSADEFVIVNATGTALIASGYAFSQFVTLDNVQTLTNKTIVWAQNNISTIPIAGGGTGATDLAGAQGALGINLKADSFNAVLTGAPTGPTPPTGDSSARLATTYFVTNTVAASGGAIPSNATPLMNGVAASGSNAFVSRDDHVHPVDTSRAAASAATATGTSFTPSGNVAAVTVQLAIQELDSEKAAVASPTFTGDPRAPTPLTSDNDTSIATTAFVQSLLAQQPPGVQVSNSLPLINGTASAGVGVDASRYDHIHPTDTTRAPSSASTATGTSFTPSGGIAASNVQTALAELDTEKAPKASPTFTGTVTSPQNYNVSGSTGALQINGVDAVKFDATGITVGGVPAGTIIDFAGATPPAGYLACPTAVTNVSRSTYANLFAAIGTLWGAGDGSTTFGIPYFPSGFTASQASSGPNIGTSYAGVIQDHTHPIAIPNGAASVGGAVSGNTGNTGPIQSVTGNNYAAAMRVQKCVKY